MSATLDAIRASLPDFLQQPLDEGEDDSENDDHPHRLQVEQLVSLICGVAFPYPMSHWM